MLQTEIASLMEQDGKLYEVAEKVQYGMNLDTTDKEVASVVDAWAKEIGKTGRDNNGEIAAFIQKTIEHEVYNAPDEILDLIFNRGTIGEFDYKSYEIAPKNTLVVHEAAKGGTVDKSFINISQAQRTSKHLQIESSLRYSDLRKNGFKSIAQITTYMREALRNKLFFDVMSKVDAIITGGDQLINDGAAPTKAAMDKLAAYLNDRGTNGIAITLSKYAQAIPDMSGYTSFMTEEMKSKVNRTGILDLYKGIQIAQISGAKKTGKGELLLPDKRIFGISDKIGDLDLRGEIRAYEDFDNKNETVEIKLTGFEYDVAFTDVENMAKIVLT